MKILLVLSLAIAASAVGGTVRIAGSDTMVRLNKAWAEEFHRAHRGTEIQVSGGGSEIGIRAMQDRKTDIAASSRPLSAAEKGKFKALIGKQLIEVPVATDIIAIYVHDSNPVPFLSMAQLGDIFTGKITHWSQLGGREQPIYVYIRGTNSGTHFFFRDHVLSGRPFSPRARHVEETAKLTEIVSYNSNAIGFGGYAYAKAARRIRLATEDAPLGHTFDPAQAGTGKYPLDRALYFYIDPDSLSAELKQFILWALGLEGQSIVEGVGYFALPPEMREKQLKQLGWGDKPVAQSDLPSGQEFGPEGGDTNR